MPDITRKARSFIKKEPVLIIAAALAIISAFFVPPDTEYIEYIDTKTLACLFCLMASVKGLERGGLLERLALSLSGRLRQTRALAVFLVFACYFSSMMITNDVALIAIVPVTFSILSACGCEGWSALIVVLQTIGANIGSGLTPVGNPQNLYLFTHYGMDTSGFFATMLPITAAGGVMLLLCCLLVPASPITPDTRKKLPPARRGHAAVYTALFLFSVASVFGLLPYPVVTAGVAAVILLVDRRVLAHVDYSLLATFVVIFIFVGNIGRIDFISAFLLDATRKSATLSAILTSQFTSNVPAAILLSGFTRDAHGLLAGVNIGGMGTLIASMASVISYKIFCGVHRGQSSRYIKLFTLLNLAFLAALTAIGLALA